MPLGRIPGEDELYIGSVFLLGQQKLLDAHNITHILSVLHCTPRDTTAGQPRQRLCIDVDDVEDEDLVVHFPRCVRFIDSGLRGQSPSEDGHVPARAPGAVFVHCAMGKSRSASAVIAYLLWRYPSRFQADSGAFNTSDSSLDSAKDPAEAAVARALALVREARAMAEPNDGFMRQLALWWRMGCPADTDDAVERHPAYQRWAYHQDVQQSVQLGRGPERLWFGDEKGETGDTRATGASARTEEGDSDGSNATTGTNVQLRCKKCRRVLAASPFIQQHPRAAAAPPCPHHFIEPLSWMRPVLEQGALDGRLCCPNPACGAVLGRYAWQGFQCSCRAWVCPAFSLQRSRVDEVRAVAQGTTGHPPFGIRMPPGRAGPAGHAGSGTGGVMRTGNL